MQFFTLADVNELNVTILLYGQSGVGKTVAALSVAHSDDLSPALVVDIDRGLRSVAHLDPTGERLRIVRLSSVLQLKEISETLLLPDEKRPVQLRGIKSVIIDSLSAFRDETMTEIRKVEASKGKRTEFSTQLQDYNQALAIIDTTVSQLKSTGIHIILTAEQKEIVDNASGLVLDRRPELNPRLAQAIHHKMDHIWPVEKKGDMYAIRVLGTAPGFMVKNRGPLFERALKADEHVTEKGFFVVPDFKFPTIPYLYNIYLKSLKETE